MMKQMSGAPIGAQVYKSQSLSDTGGGLEERSSWTVKTSSLLEKGPAARTSSLSWGIIVKNLCSQPILWRRISPFTTVVVRTVYVPRWFFDGFLSEVEGLHPC